MLFNCKALNFPHFYSLKIKVLFFSNLTFVLSRKQNYNCKDLRDFSLCPYCCTKPLCFKLALRVVL